MGLATLFGIRPQGWFIPYRYADTVAQPAVYSALEPLFAAAEQAFAAVLADIDGYAAELEAIGPASSSHVPPQPRWNQGWFPRLDAAAAYAMVRTRKPARIVEIGSGHSTRFMARAVADGALGTDIVAIDPAPRAAIADLGVRHVAATLHDADTLPGDEGSAIAALGPGDILFIDSSHILMPGTDVDYLLNNVWPSLAAGVVVHIHDMLLPDGYPAAWTWRGYNEQSAVAPLLTGGAAKLLFAAHYAATRMTAAVDATVLGRLPLIDGAIETSLWIEKS
jgi:predicted O-methyltransferase YrrM